MTIETISLDKINEDESIQIREEIDLSLVDTYRILMKSNGPLALLDVFKIGVEIFVVDGFHRLEAARELGWKEIECEVHEGDRRDAVLFAAGANASHGQPLSRSEKTRAVETLLEDEVWFQWSNARIGRHCGVTGPTVARVRERYINELGKEESSKSRGSSGSIKKSLIGKRQRTDRHGNAVKFTPSKGRKPQTQAEKNLAELNGALDTLARLPFTASFAVDTFGSLITDNAGAALEWLRELSEAKSHAS